MIMRNNWDCIEETNISFSSDGGLYEPNGNNGDKLSLKVQSKSVV